ncbi:MAG: hypothetical protein RL660_1891 [Bacteroidota bacterium]|jgi:hypothetical protein
MRLYTLIFLLSASNCTASKIPIDSLVYHDIMITGTPYSISGFVGSGNVQVVKTGDGGATITIFNVTSLTSGALGKELDFTKLAYPNSYVRDLTSQTPTQWGNISQEYSIYLTAQQLQAYYRAIKAKRN